MKKLLTIILILFLAKSEAQTANAGADQTIYLTQGSTATIGGASSGTSYLWSKLYLPPPPQSTNPVDPAAITSPTSAATTVTGLVQGNWFYRIAVTTGAATVYDTVVVRVNYDVPPGTLLGALPLSEMKSVINNRTDTTSCCISTGVVTTLAGITIDRARNPFMYIDALNSNFWSTVGDGYGWNHAGYNRTELSYNLDKATPVRPLDTTRTIVMEWRGYFAQDLSTIVPNGSGNRATIIMQIHGKDPTIDNGPPFEFDYNGLGNLTFHENMTNWNGENGTPDNPNSTETVIMPISSLYNHAHTIRWTIREGAGYPGQDAFLKIEVDGVQKYYRNNGQVGEGPLAAFGKDYFKFNTIYDFGNVIVNSGNSSRGRQVTLVTQEFNMYQLSTTNQPPVANAGTNQTIVLLTNIINFSGSGTDSDGTITSYSWGKNLILLLEQLVMFLLLLP